MEELFFLIIKNDSVGKIYTADTVRALWNSPGKVLTLAKAKKGSKLFLYGKGRQRDPLTFVNPCQRKVSFDINSEACTILTFLPFCVLIYFEV